MTRRPRQTSQHVSLEVDAQAARRRLHALTAAASMDDGAPDHSAGPLTTACDVLGHVAAGRADPAWRLLSDYRKRAILEGLLSMDWVFTGCARKERRALRQMLTRAGDQDPADRSERAAALWGHFMTGLLAGWRAQSSFDWVARTPRRQPRRRRRRSSNITDMADRCVHPDHVRGGNIR